MFNNELSEEQKLKEQIKSLDRETLENKFVSLFMKHKESVNKPVENNVNFENHKTMRRQQYLHKTYTKNATALNKMLSILLETNDENLQKYFNNLNKELEIKATQNNDIQN